MKNKFEIKIISFFLVTALLIGVIPLNVIAESQNNGVGVEEQIKDVPRYAPDEYVKEIREERGEFSKTFERGDGTYTTILSTEPMHYRNEKNEWEEIDNSLETLSDHGGSKIVNKHNDLKIEFPSRLSTQEDIHVSKDKYKISFKLMDEINSVEAHVENNARYQSLDNQNDAKSFLSETPSKLDYQNVQQNTDILFELKNGSLNKSIMIYEKPYHQLQYKYRITTEDLVAVLMDDHSIEYRDSNSNETKFKMPAPSMVDSSIDCNMSNAIDISFTEIEKGVYELIYTPDMSWFQNDISYPISINPTITIDHKSIEDTYVSTMHPTSPLSNFSTISVAYSEQEITKSYIKIKGLPNIPKDKIIQSSLHYNVQQLGDEVIFWGPLIDITPIKNPESINIDNLTYNRLQNIELEMDDNISSQSGGFKTYDFDLTKLHKQSYVEDEMAIELSTTGFSDYEHDYDGVIGCYFAYMKSVESDFPPYLEINHYPDDPFPDDTKVNIRSTKAAVFEDQNIVPIEEQSDLTGTFDRVSLQFSESAQRLGGFLTFHDGDTTESYFFAHYICQSHLDITGNRSLIAGATNYPADQGYVLMSFRIEENCDPLTLMPANLHLKGKTVISIGLLNKATNKLYYMQQEVEGLPFDTLYQKSVPNDNDYAFMDYPTTPSVVNSSPADQPANRAIQREREYISLKRRTSDHVISTDIEIDPAEQANRVARNQLNLQSEPTNGSEPSATAVGYRSMRDLLDHLRTNRKYSINDPVVSELAREHFLYPTPYHWFGYWVGFNDNDAIVDQLNPYFYARYAVRLAGTKNCVISIILVDIRSSMYNWNRDLSIQVRANMDIHFDAVNKIISVYQAKDGNARINQAALVQKITNKAGSFTNGIISSRRSQDAWGTLYTMFTSLGVLPKGSDAILDGIVSAFGIVDKLREVYLWLGGAGDSISPVISIDSHVIGAKYGSLAKPNDDVVNPGSQGTGDFALLQGTVDRNGYYEFMDYFTIEVAIAAFDKYPRD